MEMLAAQPNAIFMGQAVAVAGTGMRNTLLKVPDEKLLELPVFEDTQMGMAIGMSLNGYLPISIYPRWNFLLCATNQLVNHLDKLAEYSDGGYRPKVIVRTAVATPVPLHPGPQHLGDYTAQFRAMCPNVHVARLDSAADVEYEYARALGRKNSSLLVERTELY